MLWVPYILYMFYRKHKKFDKFYKYISVQVIRQVGVPRKENQSSQSVLSGDRFSEGATCGDTQGARVQAHMFLHTGTLTRSTPVGKFSLCFITFAVMQVFSYSRWTSYDFLHLRSLNAPLGAISTGLLSLAQVPFE